MTAPRLQRRGWFLVVLGVVALAGCGTQVSMLDLPVPPAAGSSGPTTTAAVPIDGTAVGEVGVGGVTTTTAVALRPGSARISGVVRGPNAPVAGATVALTRLVGDQVATTTVTSGANGRWSLTGILGGRYRVRAWKAPQLALTSPSILFVAGGQPATVDLTMTRFQGPAATASYNPYPPVQGQPTAVRVEVATPVVAADGTVSYTPVPGRRVALQGGTTWSVPSGSQMTGADGTVDLVATCEQAGAAPLYVQIGAATFVALTTPTCAPAPTTTTTTTPRTTTTTTAPTTTTTVPPTTTTTAPVATTTTTLPVPSS